MKALGLLHPFLTLSTIIATGNHWVLDAVGGAVVVGAGFGLSYVFQGPRAARTPGVLPVPGRHPALARTDFR